MVTFRNFLGREQDLTEQRIRHGTYPLKDYDFYIKEVSW